MASDSICTDARTSGPSLSPAFACHRTTLRLVHLDHASSIALSSLILHTLPAEPSMLFTPPTHRPHCLDLCHRDEEGPRTIIPHNLYIHPNVVPRTPFFIPYFLNEHGNYLLFTFFDFALSCNLKDPDNYSFFFSYYS